MQARMLASIYDYADMKSFRKELSIEIPSRMAFLNLTPRVRSALRKTGIREGLCLVNSMHISSSVFINDDECGLHADFTKWLEGLAPHDPVRQWRHNDTGEERGCPSRAAGDGTRRRGRGDRRETRFQPGRIHGVGSAANVGAGCARTARSRTHCCAGTVSRPGNRSSTASSTAVGASRC